MIKKHRLFTAVMALLVMLSCFGLNVTDLSVTELTARAVSADYPMQLMNLAAKDNSAVLTENDTTDNSTLSMKALGGDLAPAWRFDRVGNDSKGTFFKLTNAQSGRLLTPKGYSVKDGSDVVVYGSESAKCQHWYVVPVKQDHLGNDLYYKIVNYENTDLALTQTSGGMNLSAFKGSDDQLFLLNSDGLHGFAGYCANDNTGNIKAGDIGGLFGEIVEAGSFDELKKYAESDTTYTILVTKNISVTNLKQDSQNHLYCPDGRIYVRSNKTIVGSYGNHTLNNVQFCTATKNGVGNNVIIKNFDMQHDAKSNGNDSIVVYFGSGENLWVDHVTFTGHSGYNTLGEGTPDWDKFLACCYDADYCTVSDCYFGLHEYGLILGYPDDTENSYQNKNNFPRMTIISCKFKDTLTRAPGLMRYGYFHSLCNYVYNFSMAYTVHSDCKLFAENCYYDGASTKGNVVCDWNEVTHPGAFADSGSKGVNCKRLKIEGSAKPCSWKPTGNYSYKAISADQAKSYCDSYSGCQSQNGNVMYLRYSAKGIPSAGYTEAPDGPPAPVAASFPEGSCFKFKNANSGLYMSWAGKNVVQYGPVVDADFSTWKLYSAGDDWYYLEAAGSSETLVLDVEAKKADDGTNIDIYKYNGGANQQFMLMENADGTYKLLTKTSGGKSAVEVASASKEDGANVQQWADNGESCQCWILEKAVDPGSVMDISVLYEFENVNSGMVMDIKDGKMEPDTNVQQWGSNGFSCQRWKLLDVEPWANEYAIVSAADERYALSVGSDSNGGNISIKPYDYEDMSERFMFIRDLDGSYYIKSRLSNFSLYVEVAAASKESGANVQQWELTNSDCQKWAAVTVTTTTTTTTTTTVTTTTTTAEPAELPTEPPTEPSVPTTAAPTEPTADIVYGDANCDGVVTIADATAVLQHIGNPDKYALSAKGMDNADVYSRGDGISGMDALSIQKLDARLITSLPESYK